MSDVMTTTLFVPVMITFILVIFGYYRILKIERMLKPDDTSPEMMSLLAEYKDCAVKLSFHSDYTDYEASFARSVRILDVDEKWVLVSIEKRRKKLQKLIRISTIKSVKPVNKR